MGAAGVQALTDNLEGNDLTEDTDSNLVELATELTIAWLGNPNNRANADDVPAFLRTMHATVSDLSGGQAAEPTAEASEGEQPDHVPAVSVRKSLGSRDHIISLIDGRPYRTLRRHLSKHGLTPDDYRKRYNLKSDYPMVAPNYSEQRRDMAKKIGLGNKGRNATAETASAADAPAPAPTRRRRTKRPEAE